MGLFEMPKSGMKNLVEMVAKFLIRGYNKVTKEKKGR